MDKLVFDPMSAEFRRDAMHMYQRFLLEDPVHRADDGRWLICRHADVLEVLKDSSRFQRPYDWAKNRHPEGPLSNWSRQNMIILNPPDHTRFRKAVARAFSAKRVAGTEPTIKALAADLAERLSADEQFDFMAEFAYPLPITFICSMMGIPAEDHDLFKDSTAAIIAAIELSATPDDKERAAHGVTTLYCYLEDVAKRRENDLGEDLISLLIKHEKQDNLSRREVIHAAISLLIAGHETTTHLIGNGMIALTQHPEQIAVLNQDRSLIPNAVEEMLRYDPSLYVAFRSNREDWRLDGKDIPANSFLVLALAAANRDPSIFENPNEFDVSRANASDHLSFAAGIHMCLGHAVARMEATIAFQALFDRFDCFELTAQPTPRNGLMFKGYHEIPITMRAA